ncbi:hypothetical protein PF010_g24060 [Phytophthora fragariae]|uniref:Uncharacterized protein n=1 Tax=Phytophthora fragariae TaxID=53985 RepID=A0A6A3I7Q0_9STRA|nr:hypothetical protein PF011_g23364 [Phytophthora fragariae]KAE9076052.1 hypothetical protein PF010_g24060 [Phytophthora fragariae]
MVSMVFAIASAIWVGLATSHGADELRECGVCDEFISCFMCIGRCFTSQCVWCDCELWYDCFYDRYSKRQWCCCDCCQLLLDDSKCLCFSRKHGDSDCCESFYENGRIHADPIVRPNDP